MRCETNREEFGDRLDDAGCLRDVFELVKEAVRKTTGRSRAGLMLGLSDLGTYGNGFIGAYYPVDSNIIVLNRTMLARVLEKKPHVYRPYAFHLLLHEYIHSLGLLDEDLTRKKTYEITSTVLGEEHPATQLAVDMASVFPELIYAERGWHPEGFPPVDLVKDFARSDTTYIA